MVCFCLQDQTVLFPSLLEVDHLLISMVHIKIPTKFFFHVAYLVGEVSNIILFSVEIGLVSTLETSKRLGFFFIKNSLVETERGHCPHQHNGAYADPLHVSMHRYHI